MLTSETVLSTLNPWLSEPQTSVELEDGTTEGTISSGAFAANIVQAAILNTGNPNPVLMVADLLADNDGAIAQELVIQASENVDKLLTLRAELETAIRKRLKEAFAGSQDS